MTWQVLRIEFDQMLLENAQEKEAEVQRGVSVREVLFEGEKAVGVRAKLGDGRIVRTLSKGGCGFDRAKRSNLTETEDKHYRTNTEKSVNLHPF